MENDNSNQAAGIKVVMNVIQLNSDNIKIRMSKINHLSLKLKLIVYNTIVNQ